MGTRRVNILAFCAVLLALPLSALDTTVKRGEPERDERGWQQHLTLEAAATAGGRLLLRADNGGVSILPTPGDKVGCIVTVHTNASDESTARRLFDTFQLTARATERDGVYISSQSPRRERHGNLRVQFQITVPQRYNLDIETRGGDISVEAPLDGEARMTTAGGDVRSGDLTGPVRIETAGGSISLGRIGGELNARTAGGSIHVGDVKGDASLETSGGEIATGTVTGTLKAETAGGDVTVGGASGQVVAQTAGGQIRIGPTGSSVTAQTAGGSIRLQGARGHVLAETAGGSIDLLAIESAVRASTAAGRILAQFNSSKKTFGPSELETSMGDVFVYLPPNLPLTIDAAIQTAAGRQIQSDFPLEIQGAGEELVPSTLVGHGELNGGGDVLKIRTTAGNIEIRKIDAASLRELQQREESNWKNWQNRGRDKRSRQDRERQPSPQERGDEHEE